MFLQANDEGDSSNMRLQKNDEVNVAEIRAR
jgi:hypothetical protein